MNRPDAAARCAWEPVRDYMLPFREAGAAPPAVPGPPKARDLASWILTHPDNLKGEEKTKLASLFSGGLPSACPPRSRVACGRQ
ncbi:MAG: hypothetical protein ACRDNW_24775 [Trebonia sp.]